MYGIDVREYDTYDMYVAWYEWYVWYVWKHLSTTAQVQVQDWALLYVVTATQAVMNKLLSTQQTCVAMNTFLTLKTAGCNFMHHILYNIYYICISIYIYIYIYILACQSPAEGVPIS